MAKLPKSEKQAAWRGGPAAATSCFLGDRGPEHPCPRRSFHAFVSRLMSVSSSGLFSCDVLVDLAADQQEAPMYPIVYEVSLAVQAGGAFRRRTEAISA